MIFARRCVQKRLDELRTAIGDDAVDGLITRLNKRGSNRMAAMWETMVLHALTECGKVCYEMPLSSGRKPDIAFANSELCFTADVTSVSDKGIDENNPYWEFSQEIHKALYRLGLRAGVNMRVHAMRTVTPRGSRTVLRLPPRSTLQTFVRERILPEFQRQKRSGERVLRVAINDDSAGIDIEADTINTRSSTLSFAAYDQPGMKDRNPLYSGLKQKAVQLRAAEGLTGIFVGDGDCRAMKARHQGRNALSTEDIVYELFRQYTKIDFVLLLLVHEDKQPGPLPTKLSIRGSLHVRNGCTNSERIAALCRVLVERMPEPHNTAVNGAMRARDCDYGIGRHGGYTLSGNTITVSLREMTEVLAGLRTFADDGAENIEAARRLRDKEPQNPIQRMIMLQLTKGRLPVAMRIIKGEERDDDDLVEIEFGAPDPAISPFR